MNHHEETPLSRAHTYSIDEIARISEAFARSGYFRDARTVSQAFSKILAGQEFGIGPMTAMSMIHVVEGKTTMDATLVAAQIKKSGRYDYRVKRSDELQCTLEFFERGKPVGESTFTIDDAKRAGLAGRHIWQAYPKDMLRSRAMTRGARMYCPDVFNGAIYTPEEIGAEVAVDESGTILVVSPETPAAAVELEPELAAGGKIPPRYRGLINDIYAALELDPAGTFTVHRQALSKVATTLNLAQPPLRWSELTIEQLETFLRSHNALQTVKSTEAA